MNRWTIISLFFLTVIFCGQPVSAQTGVMRLEFPAELEKNPYEVVPLEEYGLLMFYAQPDLIGETDRSWHFTFYDTSLFIQWEALPETDFTAYRLYRKERSGSNWELI